MRSLLLSPENGVPFPFPIPIPRSLTIVTDYNSPSEARVRGVQNKLAKILTVEAKTVKTNKGQSLAKNGSKVPNCVTFLCPYNSSLEWRFEALSGGEVHYKE